MPSDAPLTPGPLACPCCGRKTTVTKAGGIRQHGHTTRGGYRMSSVCPAWRARSIKGALENALADAQRSLTSVIKTAAASPSPRALQNVESRAREVANCRKALGLTD